MKKRLLKRERLNLSTDSKNVSGVFQNKFFTDFSFCYQITIDEGSAHSRTISIKMQNKNSIFSTVSFHFKWQRMVSMKS